MFRNDPTLSRRLLTPFPGLGAALPAWAQTALAPFAVSDIPHRRPAARIGAGTVFTYQPVERGDTLDAAKAAGRCARCTRPASSGTCLDHQGSILVITVVERPAINKLTLVGNTPEVRRPAEGPQDIGLSEGETNRLNRIASPQELNRQYNNRGKYSVEISPSVGGSTATAST